MHRASAFVMAAAALAFGASPVLAHFTEWPSSTESIYLSGMIYDTRVADDTYRMRAVMNWNSTRASNMRHQASHGYRFSFDVHDLNGNLNATTRYETSLPNPYFDLDDDDSDGRHEESEITADSTSFPTAGVNYYANVYFMRYYYYCTGYWCPGWVWDPSSGWISYDESLSEHYLLGDYWDTTDDYGRNCCANLGSKNYPYASGPGSQLTAEIPQEIGADASDPPASEMSNPFRMETSADGRRVIVRPDLNSGLTDYVTRANRLATELVSTGPSRGTVTFRHPLAASDLKSLQVPGLRIRTLEAVSDPDSQGQRWTFGGDFGDSFSRGLAEASEEQGVRVLGVVSAQVEITSAAALNRLRTSGDVFLVDLSEEQVRRSMPLVSDVVVNDLYWNMAGWL